MNNIRLNLAVDFSDDFRSKAERVPAKAIGLPARAQNIVDSSGINNSYEAILFILDSITELPRIGAKTISKSINSVHEFVKIIESASENEINKLVDSRDEYLKSANGNLIIAFPAIVELYFSKNCKNNKERDRDIINKRFGLEGNKKYTLDDIGTYYDVTRERIRQIEAKSIKNIGLLLNNSLNNKNWKLSHDIVDSYQNTYKEIRNLTWVSLKLDIENILLEQYGSTLDSGHLDLFMEVCGYEKLPQNIHEFRGSLSESWFFPKEFKRSKLYATFQALDIIYDSASSISIFELIILTKKKSKLTIENSCIESALRATNDIDLNGEYVEVNFSRLRNAADKAIRVLESNGKPLHFSKITQEINLLNRKNKSSDHVKESNLTNQLVADNRFTPIGRSGEWGLSSWGNLNNITIIQAIEKVLHTSGSPLKFSEIESEVLKIRPDASNKSLKVYLNDQPIFVRVGTNEYALSAWRLSPAPKVKKKEVVSKVDFIIAIQEVLEKENPIDFPSLIEAVKDKTKLAQVSVRQRILGIDGLDISKQEGKRCKVVSCHNLEFLLENLEETELLRDRIQKEIRSILFEQPNIKIKKGDLYKEVVKNVECIKPTFYHYLDIMSDIHQFKSGNDYYAVFQHEEKVDKIEIDLDKYNADPETKILLQRPLSFLTVANVDIALFELGIIFEDRVKEFLLHQKNNDLIKVNSKDTTKLVHMISCVVREGVISKGHHLSTLREERNNRAHGKIPSIQERQDLFNKAHYISELFVKYICYFGERTQ